jgi:tetratricopeptide (TPR) repeat protein
LPLLNSVNVPVEDYERHAVADAEQALALDPSIGLAHSVLAGLAELHWRWAEARRGAELAYQQSPNDLDVLYQYMRLMRSAGNYDEAIRANERLIQLEPTTANFHTQLAIAYRYARQYEAAVAAVKRGIALNPAAGGPHVHLAYAEAALGQREEAVSELQLAEQLFAGNFGQIFRVSQMAMAYSLVGRREDAQRMFDLLGDLDRQSPVGEAVWAQAHLALGQYDEAYEQLVAAMAHPSQANYTTLIEIKANPWSLPELDAPRFREVFRGFWSTQ